MAQSLLRELAHDAATPSRFIPAVSSGFVVGLLIIVVQLSLASFIFGGSLSGYAAQAAGLTLFGGFLMCLVVALTSSFPTAICLPEDAPAAILATVAISIGAHTASLTDLRSAFVTVGAAMALSTLATGVLFLVMARFNLGSLMRYMPYPVVGGFLAGIGWLLVQGSFGIMTNTSLTFSNIPVLLSTAKFSLWLPGAVLTITLLVALRRWGHVFILPGVLLLALAVFGLYLLLSGMGIEDAHQAGLLLGGMPQGNMLWPVFTTADFGLIRWDTLLQQLPQLCTIPLVSALSFLLISSGMEAAGRRDLDLNRELIINGMANLLAGPGGSHSGYTAMSFSMFGPKTGSDSRLVGVSAALFVGAATFFGAQLLGNFPRFILGGMVLFLGIATLQDWIIDARRRVSTLDYLLMLSILGVIAFFGFLAGAGFGLLAATALFAIRYSRLPVLREEQDGTTRLSALERPIPHRRLLHQHGHDIRILRATGYLFFGSANVLADSVAQRLGKDPQGTPPPSHLILDFSGVDGFDSSAVNSFLRLLQRAEAAGTQLVFSATPAMLPDQLRRADAVQAEGARFFADLDRALEWCEDAVLARELERLESQKNTGESNALFDASVDDMMLQLERAERFETLRERLDPRLEHKTAEAGQVFLHQGEPINGLLLLVSGQAEEIRNEADGTQTRQRTLSAGAVVGHTGHAQHFQAPGTLTALSPCALVLLSAQALHRLEAEEPENALLLYSHVSSELHSLLWPASAPAPNNS